MKLYTLFTKYNTKYNTLKLCRKRKGVVTPALSYDCFYVFVTINYHLVCSYSDTLYMGVITLVHIS